MSKDIKQQSNPFSTGGGGVNFETRVQSAFAISLLTDSCVPCMPQNMRAKELKFQNKYDGSNTDDFVLVAKDQDSNQKRLYAQIKHEITLSESKDSIFFEVINCAWEDYNSEEFSPEHDSIALITGPLSKLDVNHTLPLLEWAKYSSDAKDFLKKTNTKGFTSKTKLEKLCIFRTQLSNAKGREISDDELWNFLKVFNLIGLDLDSKFSTTANLLCSLIHCYSKESASLIFAKVVTCVQEFNQNAGVLTLTNTPSDLSDIFRNSPSVDCDKDIRKLRDRGNHIHDGISSSINGVHIDRHEDILKVANVFDENDFIFVTGVRGVGKSGLVKDYVKTKSEDVPIFYLRAEDLDKNHLNDVFTSIGMTSTLKEIEGHFSLIKDKVLVIESFEKILELSYQTAFVDLLQFVKRQTGWTIIATGRDYAYQQLTFNFLEPSLLSYTSIDIDTLTSDQVEDLCAQVPELNKLIENDSLIEILKIPFFIEIAVRAIGNGAKFESADTELEFKKRVWSSVIAKEQERNHGMPAKRRKTFIEIAKRRAKKMVYAVSDLDFDSEVISKLESDDIIHRNQEYSTVSLAHDVLEDWALEEFIENEYKVHNDDLYNFLSVIGSEPAISRAYRLWLYRKLNSDSSAHRFIEEILRTHDVASFWKDETIAAILQHDSPENFLSTIEEELLKDDCALLIRFFFILRLTCQKPNSNYISQPQKNTKLGMLNALYLRPYGQGWRALFQLVYTNRLELSDSTHHHIIEAISEWCVIINIYDDFPEESKLVGLLALWLLEPLKDSYNSKTRRRKILSAILQLSPTFENEFDQMMLKEVFNSKDRRQRLSYVEDLVNMALVGINAPLLCKCRPSFVVKLAMHELLLPELKGDDHWSYSRDNAEQSFGLTGKGDFFPASGAKGPFRYLLQFHPREALDFIIELCNITSQKYSESAFSKSSDNPLGWITDETTVFTVNLMLNDGTMVEQYASPHLWKGYRGQSTLPYQLQCALMAVENWLVGYVSHVDKESINWLYDHLLRSSNSVLLTSVLASVAVGFPELVSPAAFPLLRTSPLYKLDLERVGGEKGENELNHFGLDRDALSKFYMEERKKAALRPWRRESLETLLQKTQFSQETQDEALSIIDALKDEAESQQNTSLRYLVHRSDSRTWEAVETKDEEGDDVVVLRNSAELPKDLQEDQEQFLERYQSSNSVSSLYMWSKKLFEENDLNEQYYTSHIDALAEAKRVLIALEKGELAKYSQMAIGAITTVAAVCVRDDSANLNEEDSRWCYEVIIDSVSLNADTTDSLMLCDKTDIYGANACSYVLPILLDLGIEGEAKDDLMLALAKALTHENRYVVEHAAKGVRDFLWERDTILASNCLNGTLEYSKFRSKYRNFSFHYGNKESSEHEEWLNLKSEFRRNLIQGTFKLSVEKISEETHCGWFIHLAMLQVPFETNNESHIQLIDKIIRLEFESKYKNRTDQNNRISPEIEREKLKCLADHVIRSRDNGYQPFKDLLLYGCAKAPSFIYSLVLQFNIHMQNKRDLEYVWTLWDILAPEIHKIALKDVNDRYIGLQSDLNKLLRGMMYLDLPWQGHELEKIEIELGASRIIEFAKVSANNSHVFEALASLMFNFHEIFFKDGIIILAEKLGNDSKLISKQVNTSYYLEMSIGRYLQIENLGPINRSMYDACFTLLTGVVETGAARAYYLREHLIRSRKIQTV